MVSNVIAYHDGELMNIYDSKDLSKAIVDTIDYYKNAAEAAQQALNAFKEKAYKDEELQRLQKENERLTTVISGSFTVSPEEWEKIHVWQKLHIQKKHGGKNSQTAIGGAYTYSFIPTSIGDIGTVKCVCGAEFTFRELE